MMAATTRHHLRVDYELYGGGELSEAEAHAEAGRLRAAHLGALFSLLALVSVACDGDGNTYSDEEILMRRRETLEGALEGIGELGAAIADGLYANVCELGDAYEEAERRAVDAATLGVDAETEGGAR